MRVLRVRHKSKTFYAALAEGHVICLDKSLGFSDPIPFSEIRVLPCVTPTKIVCAALNYRSHAAEMGVSEPDEPLIFFKPPSAVIGGGQPIILPDSSQQVDYEGELGIVIANHCRNVEPENVAEHIFGYICANDVTARDLQKKDGLFARAKGFDSFAPLGPWIETQVEDPAKLSLRTLVNGEVRQDSSTQDMIFTPFELVSFISGIMTLNPGDVVLTGTPSGIGSLKPGDEVQIEIAGVGVLINPVQGPGENNETTLLQ